MHRTHTSIIAVFSLRILDMKPCVILWQQWPSPNPPFALGNGEYIDDMSAKEWEEIDSQVIFCSDGSISIEVLDESI